METILTNKYPISEEEFKIILAEKIKPYEEVFIDKINDLLGELGKLVRYKKIVCVSEKRVYLNFLARNIEPNLRKYKVKELKNLDWASSEENLKSLDFYPLCEPQLFQLTRLQGNREILKNEKNIKYYACIDDAGGVSSYNPNDDTLTVHPDSEVAVIPVAHMDFETVSELLVNYLVPYELIIDNLTDEQKQTLSDLIVLFKESEKTLYLNSQGKAVFTGGSYLVENYSKISNNDKLNSLRMQMAEVIKQYYEQKCIEDNEIDLKDELLNCEKVRADIDPYEERILTDPNRGHWDLWKDQEYAPFLISVKDEMVARNPLCDINENGVIAIDFGTKSTIVVYQSDIEHSLPMGIGEGNLSKNPSKKRYENPTVMHFVDLNSFLKAYKEKKGRPKTKWEDLTISHTAMNQFSNSKSSEYYEYLHQIKQWAGQREKQFRIQSHDGKTYVLPAFMDLKEDEWNPIEIYAYYIGLYINNMRKGHGIFLDYYLSFPVTYETKIRQKIVESFEKGLKKSLPEIILNNEEVMKRFRVNGDISEPAAYAVCALQEYGFEPEGDEEVFYGIFDFGGGTTDFDFGLWKESSKRRYDYSIENFGAGGDEYLGGENLLEMLAFEVFKSNQNLMRSKGYTFTLAPKCTEFLGSDALLADSQEAEKNMHNLMEQIRPYWERKKVEIEKTNHPKIDEYIKKYAI